ncbi:MAG: glucodextranase DOMON-like domain-containing protein [Anaerolineales bacterium]|nr:glucodextranase DOMON-like domain-containing protein [Anaerolineales bacterium]
MKRLTLLFNLIVILSLFLAACGAAKATPAPAGDLLYLNLLWHQHQPLYYKDTDGIYTRPWVRVHITKDYYDMASVVAQYPDVHVTFNLTPVLIRQLDDFAAGAKDLYWVLSEKPAAELNETEKRFILTRFFDANWDNVIGRFPRYRELLNKRGGTDEAAIDRALATFSEQDFRDLQIWFNLAWFDPDFLAVEPLKPLVEKNANFTEEDKAIIFSEVGRISREVIPLHKALQEKGQIEVITTPYAHPILPLIYDTNLALVGNPDAEMPERFSYPNDAVAHLQRSVQIYTDHFGQAPRGLWPGEGAVAEEIVPMVAKAGYQWMATGEPVLAQSLGLGSFTRDFKETVQQADALYRPYYVQGKTGGKVAVFFRDWTLSDKLGFTYSGMPGKLAAQDLITRLENIRTRLKEEGATSPHVVSIILDGENAWEYYDNDGKEFFHEFYRLLSESDTIKTITPSEYLKLFPEQRELENLAPGAWFSANYDTWIGEAEEKQAWNYLGRVRNDLSKYDMTKVRAASPEAIALALDYMYLAEGSDWFWWYGSDQDSGQDEYFDAGFRALLAKVYESLGEVVPSFVNVPIIPKKPAAADQNVSGLSSPGIDGQSSPGEWDTAAIFSSGAQAGKSLAYTFDAKNLYLRVSFTQPPAQGTRIGFYFTVPGAANSYPFTRAVSAETPALLGIAATHLFEWDGKDLKLYPAGKNEWSDGTTVGEAVLGTDTLEAAIPWETLGELEAGDDLRLIAAILPGGDLLPLQGPAQIVLPDLGTSTVILAVSDPQGDDHGPGAYTYPTDSVFKAQVFDLKTFTVSYDEKNLIFKFAFYGPIPNPWGSPNNLAVQTLDVYVDKDPGKENSGARLLLPGRNAALAKGFGWEYAVWAEGWTPQILAPDATTLEPKQVTGVSFKIIVDPAAQTVTLRVPRAVFGAGDPASWAYAAAVLSQEGFPSTGVWRVRDVNASSEQWRFGGGPDDTNHTRIIDLAWPEGELPAQEKMLSTYTSSAAALGQLKADDFPQIQMLVAK